MRLIDADALKRHIQEEEDREYETTAYILHMTDSLRIIDSETTVDAIPVVRCSRCKHWKCFGDAEDGDYDIGTCELYNQGFGAECFCSNGERGEEHE